MLPSSAVSPITARLKVSTHGPETWPSVITGGPLVAAVLLHHPWSIALWLAPPPYPTCTNNKPANTPQTHSHPMSLSSVTMAVYCCHLPLLHAASLVQLLIRAPARTTDTAALHLRICLHTMH